MTTTYATPALFEGLEATSDSVIDCAAQKPHRWVPVPVKREGDPFDGGQLVSICARCFVRQCDSVPPGTPPIRENEFRCVLAIHHLGIDHFGADHRWPLGGMAPLDQAGID